VVYVETVAQATVTVHHRNRANCIFRLPAEAVQEEK
jgi:hypothetical protein